MTAMALQQILNKKPTTNTDSTDGCVSMFVCVPNLRTGKVHLNKPLRAAIGITVSHCLDDECEVGGLGGGRLRKQGFFALPPSENHENPRVRPHLSVSL